MNHPKIMNNQGQAASPGQLTPEQAMAVLETPDRDLDALLDRASEVRDAHFGRKATLCTIVNAKSGQCHQDCSFCAQSIRHGGVRSETYPLISNQEIQQAFDKAARFPIQHFGMVTSGKTLSEADLRRICELLKSRPASAINWCASFGMLNEAQFRQLKAAGLTRFHHNLETAESYFPKVCTTHTYEDRKRTVLAAKAAGLAVCSGGLFGIGESPAHRVELAFTLKDLGVDSIPLNFLVPIPGTPAAEHARPLTPGEILKTIAMFRLVCPRAEIRVCAGREKHLKEREAHIFRAGATGMMIGGYLTVQGRTEDEDLALLKDADMTP